MGSYRHERDMYPSVRCWLASLLADRHPKTTIRVFDSSHTSLARLIQANGLVHNLPAEWPSWDIQVDIVGFVISDCTTQLAFAECKNSAITLRHLSQLIGYCRVANPRYSFLTSPYGPSDSLKSLLVTFGRTDILEYYQARGQMPRSIVVARWSEVSSTLDQGSLIGASGHYLGGMP